MRGFRVDRSDLWIGIASFFLTIAMFVGGAFLALRALLSAMDDTW